MKQGHANVLLMKKLKANIRAGFDSDTIVTASQSDSLLPFLLHR
jgi:hypothetical protein